MTRRLIAILLSLILVFSAAPGVAETAHDLVDLGAEALQNEEYDAAIQYFLQAPANWITRPPSNTTGSATGAPSRTS